MQQKITQVQKILDQNNFDAFLFISPVNRFWLSEFHSSFGFIIVCKKDVFLYLDGRYIEKAKFFFENKKINILKFESLNKIIEDIKKMNIKKIFCEEEYLLASEYLEISNFFEIKLFCTRNLRIVKSIKEIEKIKKAVDIACEAINWISKIIKIGMTEKDVANLLTNKMKKLGSSANSFSLIVASGVNGSFPHHETSDKKINNNEFVTIDMGCIFEGYCSDITRTFPIGKPNEKLIEAYKIVYEANKKGIENSKVNITGKDLDAICRNYINNTEFKNYFNHSTGHGVGIEVHEFPNVSPNYNEKIPNNSIITIEPGIYIPNLGGIRIEDMILINNNEPINLSEKAFKWNKF